LKPYYSDSLVKIYNAPSVVRPSETVYLDPPGPVDNAYMYEADFTIVSVGSKFGFYLDQFYGRTLTVFVWRCQIGEMVLRDTTFLMGNTRIPKPKIYSLPIKAERWHDNERPLQYMLDLLRCTKGDIYDPFCGSGTTAVAAKLLGRKCICYDIDEECCRIAAERCMKLDTNRS